MGKLCIPMFTNMATVKRRDFISYLSGTASLFLYLKWSPPGFIGVAKHNLIAGSMSVCNSMSCKGHGKGRQLLLQILWNEANLYESPNTVVSSGHEVKNVNLKTALNTTSHTLSFHSPPPESHGGIMTKEKKVGLWVLFTALLLTCPWTSSNLFA